MRQADENSFFANLALLHCVTILRDGFIVDIHRPRNSCPHFIGSDPTCSIIVGGPLLIQVFSFFFWKLRHILFENLQLSENPSLCDTIYWQNIHTLRDRNIVVAENPSFANLAWPHCVTILRDGNIVDLHRPSSIVHRPSSIVQRPGFSTCRSH